MLERLFKTGERVEVLRPVDLMPYTVLTPGERGTVARTIDDMGIHAVEIRMDTPHEGLRQFDNLALLTAPETDYIGDVRVRTHQLRSVSMLAWGGLAATLGTLKAHAATIAAMVYGLTNSV